jgi:signal transduction histidine kinase
MAGPGKRGKYLGFVAHEIKNPLATALWSCDLLKRMDGAERGGERAEKMIDVSLRALRRMRRLVDDFFTIERLHEHGYHLKVERIALRDLVEPAVRTLAEKDGIPTEAWKVELGDGATTGDRDMLERAIRLAIEHMARAAAKPHLSISAGGEGGRIVLRVRSDFPPTPIAPPAPEERPSGDPTGAVLGFALASTILEAHGGRVEEADGGLRLVLPTAE